MVNDPAGAVGGPFGNGLPCQEHSGSRPRNQLFDFIWPHVFEEVAPDGFLLGASAPCLGNTLFSLSVRSEGDVPFRAWVLGHESSCRI
jgi:hypothetical protein